MSEVLRASLVEYREGKRPCFTTSYRNEFGETVNVQNIVTMDEIREIRDSCDKILPKRNPLPDGTLPLTEEEKKEFISLILWHQHYELESVAIVDDLLTIGRSNNGIHCDYIFSHSVKAILYLASLFDLEV